MGTQSRSATIRARLDHPVIDSDGHLIELVPLLIDYIRAIGGAEMARRYERAAPRWHMMSIAERREAGTPVETWWTAPTRNTLDRATATLPRLLSERMDDLGLDFCVLYPSAGLRLPHVADDEFRRVACRAFNTYVAELYGPYADRMTPAAAIPMHTPEEAIAELEYAVGTLGLKAAMIAGFVRRPVPALQRRFPDLGEVGDYFDTYGPESPYDYDPFWAKCLELGVAPGAHSAGLGIGFRRSLWNYMYNHLGHFGEAGGALCKSLFFSGVTRRFPGLRVAFLECGVGWAADVYAGLFGRWEKRNGRAIADLDPVALDRDLMLALIQRYGEPKMQGVLDQMRAWYDRPSPAPAEKDDFRLAGIERPEDIRDRFVPNFFFGCEADDPINAWAFNTRVNPYGARLNAILSSDIGHWDVRDMTDVLAEAYELVERGLITEEDFRDFTFTNPVKLFTDLNPDFFAGTRCAEAVQRLRAARAGTAAVAG